MTQQQRHLIAIGNAFSAPNPIFAFAKRTNEGSARRFSSLARAFSADGRVLAALRDEWRTSSPPFLISFRPCVARLHGIAHMPERSTGSKAPFAGSSAGSTRCVDNLRFFVLGSVCPRTPFSRRPRTYHEASGIFRSDGHEILRAHGDYRGVAQGFVTPTRSK